MFWSIGQRFVLLKVRKVIKQENNCDVKYFLINIKVDVNKIFDLIFGIEFFIDIYYM